MAAKMVPGHELPDGVDPQVEESIRSWVASFGNAAMTRGKYAEMLIAEGYTDLYTLEFSEAELQELNVLIQLQLVLLLVS